jgi:hypothetical protein
MMQFADIINLLQIHSISIINIIILNNNIFGPLWKGGFQQHHHQQQQTLTNNSAVLDGNDSTSDKLLRLRGIAAQEKQYNPNTKKHRVVQTFEVAILERPISNTIKEIIKTTKYFRFTRPELAQSPLETEDDVGTALYKNYVNNTVVLPVALTTIEQYDIEVNDQYLQEMEISAIDEGAVFVGRIPGALPELELISKHYLGSVCDDEQDYWDRGNSLQTQEVKDFIHPVHQQDGDHNHILFSEFHYDRFQYIKTFYRYEEMDPVIFCTRANCSFCLPNNVKHPMSQQMIDQERLKAIDKIKKYKKMLQMLSMTNMLNMMNSQSLTTTFDSEEEKELFGRI